MVDEHSGDRVLGGQGHSAFGRGAGVDREGFVHAGKQAQCEDTARSRSSARSVASQVKSGSSRPKWRSEERRVGKECCCRVSRLLYTIKRELGSWSLV